MRRDRARYGVDGGYGGIAFLVVAGASLLAGERWASRRGKRLVSALAKIGIVAVPAVAASYFYSTGPGKLSVWKEVLDGLDLRGDEDVLDIGCGRGAVLISAAHRLPWGRATGADIWRLRDQTGNSRAAAEHNAMVEGVGERVEFAEADARDLPFPPGSFDVVLSNLALSNIRGGDERARALREAVRVLRPGGRGLAFPAITSRLSRPESQPPGLTASRKVNGAGPVLVTRRTYTKAQARAGVLVLGLHRS